MLNLQRSFAFLQATILAGLLASFLSGHLDPLIHSSFAWLSFAIGAIGLICVAWSWRQMLLLRDVRIVAYGGLPQSVILSVHSERVGSVKYLGATMTLVGFLATIAGFVIALSGENIGAASGATSTAIFQQLLTKMVNGSGVALHATLIGSFFGAWLEINGEMMRKRLVNLRNALRLEGTWHD